MGFEVVESQPYPGGEASAAGGIKPVDSGSPDTPPDAPDDHTPRPPKLTVVK